MSTDKVLELVNKDTPDDVKISSLAGVAMWVAGKWGIGLPIAGVVAWFLTIVYQDLRIESASKSEMVKSMVEVQQANVKAIDAVAGAVQANTEDIKELRREIQK